MTKYIVVDVEADGPIPGKYSMISLGAVLLDDKLETTFYATLKPTSPLWNEAALAVSGFSREETMNFRDADEVILEFSGWLASICEGDRLVFVSDNAGFDWQFVNYYFHYFLHYNPFGHSPMSLTWLYKGFSKNVKASFRPFRGTPHDHNALNDAIGNAEALNKIKQLGMKL